MSLAPPNISNAPFKNFSGEYILLNAFSALMYFFLSSVLNAFHCSRLRGTKSHLRSHISSMFFFRFCMYVLLTHIFSFFLIHKSIFQTCTGSSGVHRIAHVSNRLNIHSNFLILNAPNSFEITLHV